MRLLGMAILMTVTAATAWAEDAYIQLEAWRTPAEARTAAQDWAARFPDIVTYSTGTWTAIGLGPIAEDGAATRMEALKSDRAIPADAYLVQLGDEVAITPVVAGATPTDAPDTIKDAADVAPAPQTHIRLQAFASRDEAEAALRDWQERVPGAALWQLPDGWHAITTGAIDPDLAEGWLSAWKQAGAIPADAFATTEADLGTPLTTGAPLDPDTAPPLPPVMPPIDVVQEALHWAGHYDGAIDGRPGPQTNAAIAAEMAAQGIDPDAPHSQASAIQALLARRDAWQADMNLAPLFDPATGLEITVPGDRLEFLRVDRGLSIHGPRDGSGAALILFNQPGGRAEMEDLAGLVTALGWVGHPTRAMEASRFTLDGQNDTHIGHAEGRIVDGHVQGFVLIWPLADAENAPRLSAIASETLHEPAQE